MGHNPNGLGGVLTLEDGQNVGTITTGSIEVRSFNDFYVVGSSLLQEIQQELRFLDLSLTSVGRSDGRDGTKFDLQVDHVVAEAVEPL
jgi:hypothetical protein